MKLEIKEATITVSWSEATSLYSSLLHGLQHTIETHWCMHPECWPSHEEERLGMMRQLARICGHDYEYYRLELDELLAKKVAALKPINRTEVA